MYCGEWFCVVIEELWKVIMGDVGGETTEQLWRVVRFEWWRRVGYAIR